MADFSSFERQPGEYGVFSWQAVFRAVLLLVAISVVHQISIVIYNLYFHPLSHIPGPRIAAASAMAGALGMVNGRHEHYVRDLFDKYGPVVRVAPQNIVFIDSEAWKTIYWAQPKEFPKIYPTGLKGNPLKIINATAEDHPRYRRIMGSAFSDKALGQQEPIVRGYVDLLIQKLGEAADSGQRTDMVRWFNFFTFDLIGDLAFGESLDGLAEGKSNTWIDSIHKFIMIMPVFAVITTLGSVGKLLRLMLGPTLAKSRRKHIDYVLKLAEGRLRHRKQADRGDFMDYFLRSRGETEGMTEEEILENADTIMLAGSETTATLLCGVVYYLMKNPSTLKRATDEVRGAFSSNEEINFNTAKTQLPYLCACLEEALRMFPPIPRAFFRKSVAPVEISGYAFPPGTHLGIHQLGAYHSEVNFHRAREYLPERWLQESVKNPDSPFYNDCRDVLKPFGYGTRDCVGKNLANHELRMVMANLLWNFDLINLDPECKEWENQRIFALWEKPPLKVQLKRR